MISILLSCLALIAVAHHEYLLAVLLQVIAVVLLMHPKHEYRGPFDDDIEPVSDDWMMEYKQCRSVPSVHVRGLGAEELSTLSTASSASPRQRSVTPQCEHRANMLGSTGPPDGRD